MSMDWDDYEIYDPGVFGVLGDLPRKDARRAFDRLMEQRDHRVEQLRALLAANGVVLGEDDDAVQGVNDWFRDNVEADPRARDRLAPEWYSVVNDLALFLGDVMIARDPRLQWTFFTAGKRDTAYQRHVLTGFDSPNPKMNFDIDDALAGYAHQVVLGMSPRRDEFVRWIRSI